MVRKGPSCLCLEGNTSSERFWKQMCESDGCLDLGLLKLPAGFNSNNIFVFAVCQDTSASDMNWFLGSATVTVSVLCTSWTDYLMAYKRPGSLLKGVVRCHDTEDDQSSFIVLRFKSSAGPCFIAPNRNLWELQRDLKPCDPWSGMCFDHALVILGLFTRSSMCRCGVIDEHWDQTAGES